MKETNGKESEDSKRFTKAKKVFDRRKFCRVILTIWEILEENDAFSAFTSLSFYLGHQWQMLN